MEYLMAIIKCEGVVRQRVNAILIVEADGGPLGVPRAGADVHDAKLLTRTIEAIVMDRPKPSPKTHKICVWKRDMTTQPATPWFEPRTTPRTFCGSARKSST